jgi:hypothetical protein
MSSFVNAERVKKKFQREYIVSRKLVKFES